MVLIYEALKKLENEKKPIRVAIIGAGSMSRGLVLQISTVVPGMTVCAIANRTLDKAQRLFADAGIPDPKVVKSQSELEACIRSGKPALTDQSLLVCRAQGVDAVIEVTGTLEYASHAVMEAIRCKKHVILMNAELDSTIGPILKTYADREGVMITNVDGDQPGVIMNLYRYVKAIGLKPVLCGNIKGLQDHYRNPTTQEGFARRWNQGVYMVTSFADGTKISFEQAIVANATGMRVARRGMIGPTVPPGTPLKEAVESYSADEVLSANHGEGIVDYLVGAEPNAGVFVLGTMDHPIQKQFLGLYKVGEGPLYCFYAPYHLCHFEAPYTVARAVLFRDATIAPLGPPRVDVVATAKRDLKEGETIDPIGGYMAYGQCENSEIVLKENLLPMGLAEGCRLKRDISRDEVLSYVDIELPANRLCDRLREEQNQHFFAGMAAGTA